MREILRLEYGSRAHGTATEFSDNDTMSIRVESPEFITGLGRVKTTHNSTAEAGERSGVGDTDTTVYPLRKFAELAAHGNPTVLAAFFVDDSDIEYSSPVGERLRGNYGAFISKQAGSRFRGYASSQRLSLTGQRNKKTNRPELVHIHGYDTKFAYHLIRLQIQGIELMENGWINLPMAEDDIDLLMNIRLGKLSKDEVLALSDSLDSGLTMAIESSRIQDEPDRKTINRLMHDIYMETWNDQSYN